MRINFCYWEKYIYFKSVICFEKKNGFYPFNLYKICLKVIIFFDLVRINKTGFGWFHVSTQSVFVQLKSAQCSVSLNFFGSRAMNDRLFFWSVLFNK